MTISQRGKSTMSALIVAIAFSTSTVIMSGVMAFRLTFGAPNERSYLHLDCH
jgi:hypothetical protein